MILAATLALAASVAWVLGTTFGYSKFLARRARSRTAAPGTAAAPRSDNLPTVTLIVASREPAAVIEARVRNLRLADYPADRLHIVVGVDAQVASTTVPQLQLLLTHDVQIQVVAGVAPGKAGAINAAVAAATGDVLLFADSHQSFPTALVGQLVHALDPPDVGACTGLVATPEDDGFSASYWKSEQQVRARQSAFHSVICVTGAVYAMRRELFTPIPIGTICDDLFATMTLVCAGHRVVLVPHAIALDPRRFTGAEQYRRRVRTMTGLVQLLRTNTHWLRPSQNPMWFDLWVHKVNRLALPWVVLLAAFCTIVLGVQLLRALSPQQRVIVYLLVAVAAMAFALLLFASSAVRDRFAGLLRALMVPIVALFNGARGRWNVWTPVPATARAHDVSPAPLSSPHS